MKYSKYSFGAAGAKNQARALRRQEIQRIKRARQGYWGRGRGISEPLTPRQLGIVSSTAATCACWMCMNPRKRDGERSMQERSLFQGLLQQE